MNTVLAISHFLRRFFSTLLPLTLLLLFLPVNASLSATLSDSEISTQIEQELLFDTSVPFNSIDVETREGIVTLTGTARNLLAKERATLIAETVRGVRSVINTITIEPLAVRTGPWLRNAVNGALAFDAATDSYEIGVRADGSGNVTLIGTVDSWQERSLAETVAKSVSGVTSVNNKITVVAKADRKDTEIAPEIQQRLRWDTLVDHGLIDVRVNDGTVYLSGTVGSAAEKRRAEFDAWIAGVIAVDSDALKVARWARDDDLRKNKYVDLSDSEIGAAVRDALFYDPRAKSFEIHVSVDNRYVTLRGAVDNIRAKNAAEQDARNTVGVSGVQNLIRIRPLSDLTEEEISANVKAALLRDPVTESYEIMVSTKDSVVTLMGSVDSSFEKLTAENIARSANGVSEVRNRLIVNDPDIIAYDPYVYSWRIYDYPWYTVATAGVEPKSDREIKEDIESEYFWSPFVDGGDINISVEAGVATLTGQVDSLAESGAAENNAFEGGATDVVNKLEIPMFDDSTS